jgi:RNA-directed DNA polymerase
VRTATREGKNEPLAILLGRLNPVLRGWTNYFRHGVSKATFNYLRAFVWRRVVCWLRHKHPTMTWKELRQRYLAGWWPAQGETVLVDPARVHVTRYRYRGDRIPSPWTWAERMQPTDI